MPLWFGLIVIIGLCFGIGAVLGAPFLPVLGRDVESLLDLARVRSGETIVDLGSGSGRLLRAAAKRGAYGVGYEINPVLWAYSVIMCWPQRRFIKLHLGNYWQIKLPKCDVFYVFLIDRYMTKLDLKLQAEIQRPVRLVSYVFEIPGRSPWRHNHNSFVYKYSPNSQ